MTWHGSKHNETVHLSEDQWEMLHKLAEDSEYWTRALSFVSQVQGRGLDSLTPAQLDWYHNIDASLMREIDFEEARIAFGEDSDQYKRERRRYFGQG